MQYKTINHVITWHFILACDVYGTIGDGNRMPWDSLEGDLKRFKELTTGRAVVMGRNTFESMPFFPKGLPNRRNYILSAKYDNPATKQLRELSLYNQTLVDFAKSDTFVHGSYGGVSDLVKQLAEDVADGKIPSDVWVIGGPAIWRQMANMENTGVRVQRNLGTSEPTIHEISICGVESVHLSLVYVPQKGGVTYPEALRYLVRAVTKDKWEVVSSSLHPTYLDVTSPPYTYYHLKRKEEEIPDEPATDLT